MLSADLRIILPELVLTIGIMALLMVGVFRGDPHWRQLNFLSVLLLAVVLAILWMDLGTRPAEAFQGMFVRDAFAGFVKSLIIVATITILMMGQGFAEREEMARFELPLVTLFAVLGMMVMVSARNMMALYAGLELQSLALYVLAAFQRDKLRAAEAGLKYFVLGALSSGILLFGISFLYGFMGSVDFSEIGRKALTMDIGTDHFGAALGMVLVLSAMAFKISAAPFHMWTPDVYEGAPTPITAFFAMAPKVAAMALLIRLLNEPFGGIVEQWQTIIIILALASVLLGSVAAVAQTNIKRLMAYSSIAHVGFALIGLAAANEDGVTSVLAYLAIYLAMNIGTFAAILTMRRSGIMVEDIKDLRGLAKYQPMRAVVITVLMFSLAGIPPLAGFFSKLFVFQAAIGAGLVWLAIVGVLASCVAAFYYLRIVKFMYFDDPVELLTPSQDRALTGWLYSSALSMLLILLVLPLLLDAARAAAGALVSP